MSTFKSALFYVASFIMLFLIFNVPSDTFQSALSYDAMFNIHYAKLVLLCVYILSASFNIATFVTLCSIIYVLCLLQAYCCI